jgi:hypothetical protein
VLDVDAAVPAVGAHPCQRGTANLLRGRGRAVPAPARVQHVQRGIRIQAIRGIEDPGRIRGHPVGVDVAVDFTARRARRGGRAIPARISRCRRISTAMSSSV